MPEDRVYKATIRSAKRTLGVPEGKTLLEAALEAGVAYPHGCRSGRCGACKTRLLSGEVDLLPHTPFSLTADERRQGLVLACRARLLSNIEVKWLARPAVNHPVIRKQGRVVGVALLPHHTMPLRLGLAWKTGGVG